MRIERVNKGNESKVWEFFRKYHYLSHDLSKAAECYIGLINDEIVSFCAVIQFPMLKANKMIHRLVVIPDYQGIGIGIKFLNCISNLYDKKGWKVRLITSSPSLSFGLVKNKFWATTSKGRVSEDKKRKTTRSRITYSFLYKGGE